MLQPSGMPGCTGLPATGTSKAWGTGLHAAAHRGYLPGCYSPEHSLGVQAWLLQAQGWPRGNDLAATGPRFAWGYWHGCCRPHVGLGVLARLLQVPGWPWGTGLAAAAHRGYWPVCYSPQDSLGLVAWLLHAPGLLDGY